MPASRKLLRSDRPEIRSATILYEIVRAHPALRRQLSWRPRRGPRAICARSDRSYVGAHCCIAGSGPYVRATCAAGRASITAYVLTKMRHEGMALGYRGVVNEVSLNADGEINSITLYAVERFGLVLGTTDSPEQRTPVLSGLLGLVHIPGREIENVALTAFSLEDAEANAKIESR